VQQVTQLAGPIEPIVRRPQDRTEDPLIKSSLQKQLRQLLEALEAPKHRK